MKIITSSSPLTMYIICSAAYISSVQFPHPGDITADTDYDFTCTAANGNPAADIHWYIGADNVTDSSSVSQEPGTVEGTWTVTSVLQYTLTQQHNGEVMRCEALQFGVNKAQQEHTLNVLCKISQYFMFLLTRNL